VLVSFSTNEHADWMQSDSIAAAFSLGQRAFQCFEELVELNQQMIKTALVESEKAWQMAVSGKAPAELWVHQANAARALAEKALSYNHQMLGLATHAQAELMKFSRARLEQPRGQLQALVDGITKNAPRGSEAAVTVLKSTMSGAEIAYDTVLKAAAQAIALAQRNTPLVSTPASGAGESRDPARAE
jgi:phasin family protein